MFGLPLLEMDLATGVSKVMSGLAIFVPEKVTREATLRAAVLEPRVGRFEAQYPHEILPQATRRPTVLEPRVGWSEAPYNRDSLYLRS